MITEERKVFMEKRGVNFYKRKDGKWVVRYIKGHHDNGKPYYGYIYRKTYDEAREQLDLVVSAQTNSELIFESYVVEWLLIVKNKCKLSTYNKYRTICKNHIIPAFGQYKIYDIENSIIERFISHMLYGEKTANIKLAEKTAKDIISVLKQILRYIEECGKHINYSASVLKIRQSKSHTRVLSNKEQKILFEYLSGHIDSNYNKGILLCMYTGIRVGELCALKWGKINIEDKTIHIDATIQRLQMDYSDEKKTELVISDPKSQDSDRIIPLPSFLLNIFVPVNIDPECYFLSGKHVPIEPRVIQYNFKKITKNLGIDGVSMHTLRHTFATHCIEIGFDLKSLSEILGHSSVKITLDRYVHSSLEQKRNNMDKLNLPS